MAQTESNRIEKILRTEIANRMDKLDANQEHMDESLKLEIRAQGVEIEKQNVAIDKLDVRIDKLANDQERMDKNLRLEIREQNVGIEKQFSQMFWTMGLWSGGIIISFILTVVVDKMV